MYLIQTYSKCKDTVNCLDFETLLIEMSNSNSELHYTGFKKKNVTLIT